MALLLADWAREGLSRAHRDEDGQTTAEYALVLLVAGLIVGVFATFVHSGAFSGMFHSIVSSLIHRALG
jgi:Flp pilus assembly pilin Flp